MKVIVVVGARPNFMKAAPIVHALQQAGITPALVHTGQHYDRRMSDSFFEELGLPRPDAYLGVGSDSHARQTARVMIAFEEECLARSPDLVVVVGDVNSTLACALVARKLGIAVAHVEAGLRSFDAGMPEETNRVLTDHMSDLLFTTEPAANANLAAEGIGGDRVHYVGNCMIDTLLSHVEAAVAAEPWAAFGQQEHAYALVTLHRPSNVDDPGQLGRMLGVIGDVAERLPVIFPLHPRTRNNIAAANITLSERIHTCEPLAYPAFIGLTAKARVVLTDSGGIQEETTALGVPCLTMRENTERPVTITHGTNRLVGIEPAEILSALDAVLAAPVATPAPPPLWDGRAAERVVAVLVEWFEAKAERAATV